MDRAPIDAEGPGRLREVPVHVVQHPNHVPIRNFGYRRPPWRRSSSFAMAYCREHVRLADGGSKGYCDESLDDETKLAHVARPVVVLERIEGSGAEGDAARVRLDSLEKVRNEHRNVVEPVSQRRHVDLRSSQAVKQIPTEAARLDERVEVVVRRRHDAKVTPLVSNGPDRSKLLRLERAQQLRLERKQ